MTALEARTLLEAAHAAALRNPELIPRLDISGADFVAVVRAAPDLLVYSAAKYGERVNCRYHGVALGLRASS